MSKREAIVLIEDINEAIKRILLYTKDMTAELFLSDSKTIDAVVRNMEIIGEAANHLPDDFIKKYSNINWRQIIGLRHRVVHDYFGVDVQIIWTVIEKDIPSLKEDIVRIISDLSKSK